MANEIRELAANLCSAMAARHPLDGWSSSDFWAVCRALDVNCFEENGAADLAREAYWAVPKWSPATMPVADAIALLTDNTPLHWAEAECLLRTGEFPGKEGR